MSYVEETRYVNGVVRVWIGKMNQIERRVDMTDWKGIDYHYLEQVKEAQTDAQVIAYYEALKREPKVRWKDSCKEVLGLDDEEIG